jgi:glycosyltransferase involved in cell wall biosynthesis
VLWNRAAARLGTRSSQTVKWPLFRRYLQRVVERVAPDVLHAHFGPEGVWLAPVARATGRPLVVSFYGYDISQLCHDPFWQAQYTDTLWPAVDAVVVLSEEMKDAVRAAGYSGPNLHIVHLGRDLSAFPFTPATPPVRKFISVGRLTAKKGHADTIAALAQVRAEGHDAHLRIIGDGDLEAELAALVARLGLGEHVDLAGARPQAAIAGELARADAFVLCSKTAPNGDKEGTPTVLVEAQAIGLPCVSTYHAGIPEMIPEANHRFLAPEGDVTALARCMRTLVQSPPEDLLAISRAGRRRVEEAFSTRSEAAKLHALYRDLASVPA